MEIGGLGQLCISIIYCLVGSDPVPMASAQALPRLEIQSTEGGVALCAGR